MFSLLLAALAAAQVYSVEVIEPSIGASATTANAIAEDGDVVGHEDVGVGSWRAFYWSGALVVPLAKLPGGSVAEAFGLNGADVIVGLSNDASGFAKAVYWSSPTSPAVSLGTLGGPTSRAEAINDALWVTGMSHTSSSLGHAFRSDPSSITLTDLGTVGSFAGASWGTDLNAAGEIVGFSDGLHGVTLACRWLPMSTTALSIHDPSLFTHTFAEAISDPGAIVGYGITAGGATHPFLWTSATGMSDVAPSAGDCAARDINAAGAMVGVWMISGAPRAAMRPPGGAWLDLNASIPSGCGIVLEQAVGLNGGGSIVGVGALSSGAPRGFRLTPVASGLALGRLLPALAGTTNSISLLGATPGTVQYLTRAFSTGATPVPGCPGVSLSLAAAKLLKTAVADADGRATFPFHLPAAASGSSGYLQALEHATCRTSNRVSVSLP